MLDWMMTDGYGKLKEQSGKLKEQSGKLKSRVES